MTRGGKTCFELERSSAVVEFTPQNGAFAGTTVTFALGALIRLHHLCTARLMSTGDFLTLEFNSQFHGSVQSVLEETFEKVTTMMTVCAHSGQRRMT
jgi:hypothetical protein